MEALPYKGLCSFIELKLLSMQIYTCFLNVSVGFTRFPYLPENISVCTGNSKLPAGMCVSGCVHAWCLSMDWNCIQSIFPPHI